jgi:hypothetical protein
MFFHLMRVRVGVLTLLANLNSKVKIIIKTFLAVKTDSAVHNIFFAASAFVE